MGYASNSSRSRWRSVGLIAVILWLVVLPNYALANYIQYHICRASLGLGQAVARLELFGRAMNGNIPLDQREDIETNLTNAAAEMTAAEGLMSGPIATDRANKNILGRLTQKISNYAQTTIDWSYQRQASYIANIFGQYWQGLEVTYVSSRPDALRYNANCDVFVALACYHYGRASIASTIDRNFADNYQAGANGSFRSAVQKGFSLAMDRADPPLDPGHTPWDGHAKKICCTMGTPFEWQAMDLSAFQSSTPVGVYAAREGLMLDVIRFAVELDPICEGEESERCASTAPDGHATPICNRILGRWRWFTGSIVDFLEGNRWQTTDGVHTGTWQCNRDGSVDVIPDAGGWRDTVTVSDDGASLSGQNQQGVQVTASRTGDLGGMTSCNAQGARVIFELFDPPPYSGRSPVCVSAQGEQWLQTGSTMHRIAQLVRGELSAENGCFYNSRVVTVSREFSGTLCPQ